MATPRLTPGSSLQAQEQSSPLADDNSIIPAGSFHHCHFSERALVNVSPCLHFFFLGQPAGAKGQRGKEGKRSSGGSVNDKRRSGR